MLSLKSCPRCRIGDVDRIKDTYGWYLLCLQCGYLKDVDDPYYAVAASRYFDAARGSFAPSA